MLCCFVNNIHVDYADLLWEGLHYSLEHPSTLIPYPKFIKLRVSHYMTTFPEISHRVRDKYHNLEDDEVVKRIFNSGKNKARVGMKIPSWMITDEMKLTEHYRMTTSTPRSPNPHVDEGESSAPRKSTVIRLGIPPRRSTRLTPPILATAEAEDIILQDTIQLSLTKQKSHDELEAKQNVQQAKVHLIAGEIEKLLKPMNNKESSEVKITADVQPVNVNEEEEESAEDDYELRRREKGKYVEESTLRQNDNQNNPGTRLEPRSNKESSEVKIIVVVQPVNVNEEEEESAKDDYESPRIHSTLISLDTEKLQELTGNDPPPSSSTPSSSSPKPKLSASQHILSLFKPKTGHFKRYKSFFVELQGRYGYLFEHLKIRFMPRKKFHELAQYIQEVMEQSLPKMVDTRVKEITKTQMRFSKNARIFAHRFLRKLTMLSLTIFLLRLIHLSGITYNPQLQHDDFPIWLTLKYKFERLHVSDTSCKPFAVRPRDQEDPHDDAHSEGENSAKRQKTSKHGTYVFGESSSGQDNGSEPDPSTLDDDELPTEKVLQELVEEMSQTVDEAKLRKVVNEMLRQRCTSGDEHYCQRDPKAHALSLVNQDLLYFKKGNSGPEKIVFSLHKFPGVIFPDDDIEERTSRWTKGVEEAKEEVYSNSKIVQVIKTYGELGHEHKFVTKIISRRANGIIVSITKPDYKNLNKNDIEDMYLLCINGKVEDYA
ncbi:hypothetical protein Tco_0687397 [Tanacetum coccineum]